MMRLVLPLGGCLLLAACPSDPVANTSDGDTTTTAATTTTSPGTGSTGDGPGTTGDVPTSTGDDSPTTTDATTSTTGDDGEHFEPAPGGLRRLQRHHYVGSVRYLLGDAAAGQPLRPRIIRCTASTRSGRPSCRCRKARSSSSRRPRGRSPSLRSPTAPPSAATSRASSRPSRATPVTRRSPPISGASRGAAR
ncbi:hypothetical protein [Nannocystis pusilla]|uniref:hypothetical protein n=1 Tax=Nannocystis pusilla TaxID=889268 RepID=UPI003B7C6FBA